MASGLYCFVLAVLTINNNFQSKQLTAKQEWINVSFSNKILEQRKTK